MEKDRNQKYIIISIIIAIVCAVVSLLFDYRISIGIIIGMVASICNYMILSSQMTMILLSQRFQVFSYLIVYFNYLSQLINCINQSYHKEVVCK